ncbi:MULTISPECIES: SMR family transporter [unclassified Coleofasciculus]|uniref:SMR family transporter n=1 Tax=unclassified Coleofasciculus TaxID=2692782 RepID=UPI00187FCF3C|nr:MULTISPECIES: SMR family transporter [unclassified Coleofasciculus]MBE9125817.1 small multidrug resistance protein [Coleofasciculus sp. LEGE 07081]MBE9148998.1 small multidrug resistance protein [Coleofasciculus sp. LEGE 07092]
MKNNLFLLLLILISVFLNTAGQSLLKLGSGQNPLNLYLFGGLLAYALSTVFYILILGKLNLSLVYPVVIGLTITFTTLSGVFLLKEQVTHIHWVGIGLMLSGIAAIAFGKVS